MIKTFKQFTVGDSATLEIKLPVITLGEGEPKALLVANQHGGETSGILVIEQLLKTLTKLTGTLTIVPTANPLGLLMGTRNEPVDGKDLNRSFPGNKAGDITGRLAAAIYDLAMQANFVIDLHTFSRKTPIVGIQVKNNDQSVQQQITKMLLALGPDVVWQIETDTQQFKGALDEVCIKQGIPAIGIEMPKAAWITEAEIDRVVQGILAMLKLFGMVEQPAATQPKHIPICQAKTLFAETSGIFHPAKQPLALVTQGQSIGNITSITTFKKTPVLAPANGLLLTVAHRGYVKTGSKLGSLGKVVGRLD